MYQHVDLNYDSDPARWVADAVHNLTRYEVVADATLTNRVLEIDSRHQVIRVRPGQSFQRFHNLVDRATLYVIGGAKWAPEFHTQPRLHAVPDMPDLTRFKPVEPSDLACPSCLRVIGDN